MIAFEIDGDAEYSGYLDRLSSEFQKAAEKEPLFSVSTVGFWDTYLSQFDDSVRQYHNCRTCRAFIERFGGLVTIDENGVTHSVLWNTPATSELQASVDALRKVTDDKFTVDVFFSSEAELGTRQKGDKSKYSTRQDDVWEHLSVELPASKVYSGRALLAEQVAAEKRQDVHNVIRALEEVDASTLAQVVQLLETDSVYRAEKVLGPMKWLHELKIKVSSIKNTKRRANVIFRAVALAPTGFCHPRSNVAWSLLEDIDSGSSIESAARRFKAKMDPLQYQRPQSAPTDGAIEAAEKLVEELGIARSLERRFATIDDVQSIWRKKEPASSKTGGVFGALKTVKTETQTRVDSKAKTITFEKFLSTVLPIANKIEVKAPSVGPYTVFTTSVHTDAPPILQWDSDGKRNPVSLYNYYAGSYASEFGITSSIVEALTVTLAPWMNSDHVDHFGKSAVFILSGCADKQTPGMALFPETLRSELHGCRSVIEAYSKANKLARPDGQLACGLQVIGATVRVTTTTGLVQMYHIDRWD